MNRNKIKIGIIEDLENLRKPLTDLFNAQAETVCVLAADSIEEFFIKVTAQEVPDVLLCDIGLPGLNGIDGIRKIKHQYPYINIAMLTVHHENDKIFNALCAGACGYILKNEPFPLIKKAVIDISEGGSYMSPSIARRVTEYFNPASHSPEEELTTREKEVIEWISEGYSNKAIADRLSVSLHTVKFHLRNIYSKLHISSKNELIRKTLRKEI